MLIPQRPYFTWHLAVLTYLVFAIQPHSLNPAALPAQAAGGQGRAGQGRGDAAFPHGPAQAHRHKFSAVYNQMQREEKKATVFTWPR